MVLIWFGAREDAECVECFSKEFELEVCVGAGLRFGAAHEVIELFFISKFAELGILSFPNSCARDYT